MDGRCNLFIYFGGFFWGFCWNWDWNLYTTTMGAKRELMDFCKLLS